MESVFISWLRARLPDHPLLRLGPGDDAAVLQLGQRPECVVTADLLAEGVHFELAKAGPRRVGHKALAINLSDLAAMAAPPVAAVVAFALPRTGGLELAQQLIEGMLPLAEQQHVAIAGGDTNSWEGPLVVSVTAVGQVTERGVLTRSGAKPGDAIVVTGSFGGSILGRHLDVEPRVAEALLLHQQYEIHAAIDVSDGLALDLDRVAGESGCGAVLDVRQVPIATAAQELATASGGGPSAALEHALGDGEDFELVLAVPPEEAERMLADQPLAVPLTRVGHFVGEPGLWQIGAAGRRRSLQPHGFEHPLS